MKWVDSKAYSALLEQKLSARIKELRNRTAGVGNLPGGAVGFGNGDIRDAVLTTIRDLLPIATNVPTGPVQDAGRAAAGRWAANQTAADGATVSGRPWQVGRRAHGRACSAPTDGLGRFRVTGLAGGPTRLCLTPPSGGGPVRTQWTVL